MKILATLLLCLCALGAAAQTPPNASIQYVRGSDGSYFPLTSLSPTLAYTTCNANSYVQTITVVWGPATYVQTLTYNGSCLVTSVSQWVRQ